MLESKLGSLMLQEFDSSDFGLLGEQSSPKWEIPRPGCP